MACRGESGRVSAGKCVAPSREGAPPRVWSTAALRSLSGAAVGPAEVMYAFVSLEGDPTAQDELLLDEQERSRSRRFRHPRDRRRFIKAHAALRLIVARCLGVRPELVRYTEDGDGKPRLAPVPGQLEFSSSRSAELGLFAFTRGRAVGVDVERVRDVAEALMIAEQQFTAAEAGALRSAPEDALRAAFLRCWTHKEAVVKATGEGLGRRLDSFEFELASSTARLRQFDGVPAAHCGWSAVELRSPRGHAAAGAVARRAEEPPPRWWALEPAAGPKPVTSGASPEPLRRASGHD